jgi:hypothetical protein
VRSLTWLTSWITKLVGSVLTACQLTVWPEVPEDQTVDEDGEVTWMAEIWEASARSVAA